MKFLSFFSISYLITLLYDYIKRKIREKKIKTPPPVIEDINISPIKKETKDPVPSYNFLDQENINEYNKYQEVQKKDDRRSRLNSNTIYLKLNDYYDHPDFVFVGDSRLDGDPVYGYIGDPRILNEHHIIYVELI